MCVLGFHRRTTFGTVVSKAFMVLCIVRETLLMCCLFLTHIPIFYKLIDGKPLVPNLPVGCYEMPHKLRIDFLYHYVCFFFAPTVSFSSSFCQLRFLQASLHLTSVILCKVPFPNFLLQYLLQQYINHSLLVYCVLLHLSVRVFAINHKMRREDLFSSA